MKTLVFLTSKFYPYGDANGICVKNVVDELKKNGYKIYVICEGKGKDILYDDINVIYVRGTVFKCINDYAHKKNTTLALLMCGICFVIRRIFLGIISMFVFPNVSFGRTRRVYKVLNNLYKKEKFDCVIGTFRPYDNVEAVNRFKRRNPKVKSEIIYLDILDAKNPFGLLFKGFFEKLCVKSEKRTFGINDLILFPESAREKYQNSFYDFAKQKIKFFDFPLFTATSKKQKQEQSNSEKTNIVYAGTVDGKNRNAEYFLMLAEQLRLNFNMDISVEFYGDFADEKMRRKYENSEFVKFRGKITADEVFEVLCNADCLLNLSNIITYEMVPSKIFQLFSTCNKIVNMVENEKDKSLEYFNKYPKILNIREYNGNIEYDTKLLKEFIENRDMPEIDFNKIRNTYIKNTPGEFINAMSLTE